MTNSKMTYVAALTFAIDTLNEQITASGCADWDEQALAVIEKLTALKVQTEKRNSAERKPTKVQLENANLADVVTEVLTNTDKPMTITEIMAADERLSSLSNQKVSAIVRGMGDKIVKTTDKRKSYFALA